MTAATSYLRPDNLSEALDVLGRGGFRVAAGCTDLFAATERKIMPGPALDVTAVAGLRGIARTENSISIGALTTWRDIINAPLPNAFDGLKLAAREVGASQIQNRGTIAGNLCNASPAADGVPPLLTLDAAVEVQSANNTRVVPLQDFILGPGRTALEATELVTAILIPDSAAKGQSNFLKLGARKYLVISIAMTAARIEVSEGIVTHAALAIGSCGPVATRLPDAEQQLIGAPLDPERITDELVSAAIRPIDDIRADAGYRSTSAAELMRRTIATLVPELKATA